MAIYNEDELFWWKMGQSSRIRSTQSAPKKAGGWISEYNTIYSAFTTKPSSAVAAAQNTLVKALVGGGVWDVLDWFVCLAGYTETESRMDWKSLTRSCVDVGTGNAWTTKLGIKGNGSGYLNSNFTPSTQGTHIGKDDCCYGFYSNLEIAGADQVELGAKYITTDCNMLYSKFNATNAYVKTHQTASSYLNGACSTRKGCYIANRVSANTITYYKDKNTIVTGTLTTNYIPDGTVTLLASGTGGSKSSNQISFGFAGKGLTVTQVNILSDALTLYLASI